MKEKKEEKPEPEKVPEGPVTKYIDEDGNVKYRYGAAKPPVFSSTKKETNTIGKKQNDSSVKKDTKTQQKNEGFQNSIQGQNNEGGPMEMGGEGYGDGNYGEFGEGGRSNRGRGWRGGRGMERGGWGMERGGWGPMHRGGPPFPPRGFMRGGMRGRGGFFFDGYDGPPPFMRGGFRGGRGFPRGLRGGRGFGPYDDDGPHGDGPMKRKNEFESGQPAKKDPAKKATNEEKIDVMPFIKSHIETHCTTNPDARKLAEEALKKMMTPNFCVLCNARMTGAPQATMHYNGKKCAKKVKNFITTGITKYAEQVKEEGEKSKAGENGENEDDSKKTLKQKKEEVTEVVLG